MATETLRPNAAGDECNIEDQAGAACPNHYQNVDEETPDAFATYVAEYTEKVSYIRDLYNLENHSVGSGTINSVTIYARGALYPGSDSTDQPSFKVACKTEGTAYEGTEQNLTTTWVTFSKQYTNNPNTSSAWTWTQVDALQVGVALRNAHSTTNYQTSYCTQVYVEVDYTSGIEKSSSDAGTGSEGTPLPTATLADSESGQGQGAISSQLVAIISVEVGTSVELGALLKDLFTSELGQGSDSLVNKIEAPTRGGGMKLWI